MIWLENYARTRRELIRAGYGGRTITPGDHLWGAYIETTPDAVRGVGSNIKAVMIRGVTHHGDVWSVSNPAGRHLPPLVGPDIHELLAFV